METMSDLAVGLVVRDLLQVGGGVIYQVFNIHVTNWALGVAPFNIVTTATCHFYVCYL